MGEGFMLDADQGGGEGGEEGVVGVLGCCWGWDGEEGGE